MNIDELLEIADKKTVGPKDVEAFAKRIKDREKQFEEDRRQQAADEKFMARSYTL